MIRQTIARRTLLAAGVAFAATLAVPHAVAQEAAFPTGPVRIVLPFPPGTVNDTIIRILAERLSVQWKQPVTIDNRPGASSMIGTANVAQSKPDGHTLLVNITLMLQNPVLRAKLPYDPKALVPVTQINRQQLPVFVRSDLGIDSIDKLVAYAKANPGKVNFATWGVGSTAQIIKAKMEQDKGISMTHVPYKGGAEIVKALVSGEADVAVADFLSPNAYFQNGKLRVIAVTGPKRFGTLPNVPTLAEAGVTGFEGYNWLGLFAPAGTPPAVQRKIADDIAAAQADAALQARFQKEMFVEPTATGPEEFRKIYAQDEATWTSVIRATKISLD
jgi:tripartite-type tricarboxylate transporter receptor subunit TctC